MDIDPIDLNGEAEELLASEGLPIADLRTSSGTVLLGMREGGRIIGVVGVESHGPIGLLRSLVVGRGSRRAGCGRELVAQAEAWAGENGMESLYLLTTTASDFFARLGYEVADRDSAPASIASSAQFVDLCPASATFMCKALGASQQQQASADASADQDAGASGFRGRYTES
ncbi:MAG: arsenic resistance N-acetyltransferase ArsN2 [Halofilum sp. (in: g-proteobacteria)]|nr:arsenic resistance N-acetyltransferase ArsN2 [Halofilum sp. (in: g-proteobacteria)]